MTTTTTTTTNTTTITTTTNNNNNKFQSFNVIQTSGDLLWIKSKNCKHHNTDDQCNENVKFYIKLQLEKIVLRETNSSQRSKISASFVFLLTVLDSPTNKTHTIMFMLRFWLTWTAKSLIIIVYCAYPGWQDIFSKFFKSMYKGI